MKLNWNVIYVNKFLKRKFTCANKKNSLLIWRWKFLNEFSNTYKVVSMGTISN